MKKLIFSFFVFHFTFFTIHLSVAQVIRIPADYPTIQQGIDAANPGDTLIVAPGSYFENINFNGKNITVASQFLITQDTAYISQTIIDVGGHGSVVTFANNEDSTALLCGFYLLNGNAYYGGGIYCKNSSPVIENVSVKGNQSHWVWTSWGAGGGIYLENASPILQNVLMTNNLSNGHGGGIYCIGSHPHLKNVKIINNIAYGDGGGICFVQSDAILDNVVVKNDSSIRTSSGMHLFFGGDGGGIYSSLSNLVMKNVTIRDNSAYSGGGLYCNKSSPVFDNFNRCNVFNNSSIYGNDIFSDTLVQVVVDTFSVMIPYQFHSWPITQFAFDIIHGYNEQVASDFYVSPYGDNGNTGLSADYPLKTIYHAYSQILADIENPRIVHLLEGTYSPNSNGEHFPVTIYENIHLAGVSADVVNLNAEGLTRVMNIIDNSSSHISGMTLKGGAVGGENGGGVYCLNSNPIIEQVIISGNLAQDWNPGWVGPIGGRGGGIYIENSNPTIRNSIITGNLASQGGGGISCSISDATIHDLVISDNSSGGISCASSNLSLKQTTFSGNVGAGIIFAHNSHITLLNSVMWNDSTNELVNYEGENDENTLTVSYSDIEGGKDSIHASLNTVVNWLDGNINEDPLFAGIGEHSLMLTSGSPCRNAGTPDTTGLFLPLNDLAGGPRVWEDRIDIGAYEWSNVGTDEPAFSSRQSAVSAYPNPTGGIFDFRFTMVDFRWVSLKMYDVHGREVVVVLDEKLPAGEHTVRWDVSALPAGIYFYRLSTKDQRLTTASGKLVKY